MTSSQGAPRPRRAKVRATFSAYSRSFCSDVRGGKTVYSIYTIQFISGVEKGNKNIRFAASTIAIYILLYSSAFFPTKEHRLVFICNFFLGPSVVGLSHAALATARSSTVCSAAASASMPRVPPCSPPPRAGCRSFARLARVRLVPCPPAERPGAWRCPCSRR